MNCQETQSRFDDRLDERLHAGQQAAFDAHVAACPDCRRQWQAYAGAWTALAWHDAKEPSFGFVERAMRRLDEPLPAAVSWWAWRPAWQWAALAVVVMALAMGGGIAHQHSVAVKRAALYATVRQNDYLDDYDVIVHLDDLEGNSQL